MVVVGALVADASVVVVGEPVAAGSVVMIGPKTADGWFVVVGALVANGSVVVVGLASGFEFTGDPVQPANAKDAMNRRGISMRKGFRRRIFISKIAIAGWCGENTLIPRAGRQ